MIKYLPYEEKYQDQMYDVFNELTKEEVFFKKLTKEEFSDKLFKNPNFKKEGTFLALEGDKLVGFASGSVKDTDKEMCIDRLNFNFPDNLSMTNIISSLKDFFDGFASISKSNIAKYRQELRDITKQEGFPYKVVWPTKDKED